MKRDEWDSTTVKREVSYRNPSFLTVLASSALLNLLSYCFVVFYYWRPHQRSTLVNRFTFFGVVVMVGVGTIQFENPQGSPGNLSKICPGLSLRNINLKVNRRCRKGFTAVPQNTRASCAIKKSNFLPDSV